jgi:hypothetical protein
VVASLLASATPRRAPPPSVPPGDGQVRSVTLGAVFLDRGSIDGVRVGQSLPVRRGGRTVGNCTVMVVGEHVARCAPGPFRPGDHFAVARAPDKKPTAPDSWLSDSELDRRASLVADERWKLRSFDERLRTLGAGPRVELLLSHTTYAGGPSGPFGVQRLDVLVHDVELFGGLRASADLTALNFSARPDDSQTRYQSSPVLLVRQLELAFRRADVAVSAALGRTWLRSGAGQMVVDGAQASWHSSDRVEVGAYGGLIPDAVTLGVSTAQWGLGAFARVRLSEGAAKDGTLAELSARVGWAQRVTLGGRLEAGLDASLWVSRTFDAHAELELGFGQTTAAGGLDAARVDLAWHPVEPLRVSAEVRYRGLPLTGVVEPGTLSPGQRAVHADGQASYALGGPVTLSLSGGVAQDFDSSLAEGRVGPELAVSRLGALPLGVSLGYHEDFGWVRGRDGFLQTAVVAGSLVRVLTRLSWFQQETATASDGYLGHELGAAVSVEVTPWRYLKLRVYGTGRLPLTQSPSPLGSAGVQLAGAF